MEVQKDPALLLDEELAREFGKLSNLEPGTKEHSIAVESLSRLYNLSLEETKHDNDLKKISEQSVNDEREYQRKISSDQAEKRDRVIGRILNVLGIFVPLMFYGAWMNKGFKFEETGAITSTTFRNFFGKIRPGK